MEARHHHAQGHTVGVQDPWRDSLNVSNVCVFLHLFTLVQISLARISMISSMTVTMARMKGMEEVLCNRARSRLMRLCTTNPHP
jgi:hypothetical protein